MNIELWSVGKESDNYIAEGVQYYFNKTKPWVSIDMHVLQVPKRLITADIARTKLQEEDLLFKKLQPNHYLILLDERGKQHTSPQVAQLFQQLMNQGVKTVVVLIGGAFGVTEQVRSRAAHVWSLSSLVFPHQLVRLVVAEQVYRAYSILNNSPYHHQ
jgi:23S rRNA (pseudouridine1915-N3)-methyltransferase